MIGWSGRVDIDGNAYAFLHSRQAQQYHRLRQSHGGPPAGRGARHDRRGAAQGAVCADVDAGGAGPADHLFVDAAQHRRHVREAARVPAGAGRHDPACRDWRWRSSVRGSSRSAHRADHPDTAAGQRPGVLPAAIDARRSSAGHGRRGARRSAGAGPDPRRAMARSAAAGAIRALAGQRRCKAISAIRGASASRWRNLSRRSCR